MTLVVAIIVLALIFDYINGFHDAANAIATIVSTKVLTPIQAVLWAAMFNFGAFFLFKDNAVANTISKTVVDTYITLEVILAGIIAAIFWNLLTWWYGIPSSSSHTLIGGFAGAAVAHAFTVKGYMPLGDIVASDKIMKTVYFIFLAPIIGMLISAFITLVTIKRNLWGRFAIMILASGMTFLIFDYFMDVKLEQNLSKFYRVEKYQKQALKNPQDLQIQANFQLAKSHYEESLPFLSEYKSKGQDVVVGNILKSVNLNDVLINKQREIVEKFLKYEAVKKDAFFNVEYQPKLALVEQKIASCIPVF